MSAAFDHARTLAVTLLNMQKARTLEVIRSQVELAAATTRAAGIGDADVEALIAQLMHEANVYVPEATLLEDPTDHIEWLADRRSTIEWRFWSRYKTLLEQEKKFPEPTVTALGRLTDDILGRLEQPERQAPWDCRGMVVGSVQSGKTANYCGLVCKALDAGYKLVVVLAGMHNNLRSQTQYRLDEGVLGRDSQKDRQLDQGSSLIGVGRLFGKLLPVHSLTTSLDDGDFKAPQADTNVSLGGDPVILVIKKNGSVLKNLLRWVLHVRGEQDPVTGRKVVRNVPILVIDDEADNASINTKDRLGRQGDAAYVTAINGRIRELLDAFEKSAYVGYTATPFANIFINPQAETPKHGADLFPRSFILNVSPPSNYVSPSRVFGLDGDPDAGLEAKEGLPLVVTVKDHTDSFPPKHTKALQVDALPESLEMALMCFVLACAARRARGQLAVHNSMLVHVTRFVDVQHQVAQRIGDRIESMRRRLMFGEGERLDTLAGHLKDVWEHEFVPKARLIRARSTEDNIPELTWEEVRTELAEAISKIEVKEINGHATDALDYISRKQGFSVVAVGGDKLSRGLTLEGLSISYFLRASQMYDTLMQMGRWFGYRPDYLDLCRLFTTNDLAKWYRHVAMAEVELRREFDRMCAAGLTPKHYGLRVREHPEGLLVTAMNKMTHAQTQRLSYAGQLIQTSAFSTQQTTVIDNRNAVDRFLGRIGEKKVDIPSGKARIWRHVTPDDIIEGLLKDMSIVPDGWKFQKPQMMEFIRRQSEIGELTDWTVAVINSRGQGGNVTLAGNAFGNAERTPEQDSWDVGPKPPLFRTPNANIQSPTHQALDLPLIPFTEEVLNGLLNKQLYAEGGQVFSSDEKDILRSSWEKGEHLLRAAELISQSRSEDTDAKVGKINGEVVRQVRPSSNALLLIYPVVPMGRAWPPEEPFMGLVFGFPSSHTAKAVEYKVNKVWQDLFHDEDYADAN